jgi:hypothetical protein
MHNNRFSVKKTLLKYYFLKIKLITWYSLKFVLIIKTILIHNTHFSLYMILILIYQVVRNI